MMALGPAYGADGVNVSLSNPTTPGILYVRGSEFVDESVRLIMGDTDQPSMQRRTNGVWNPADIALDSSSLRLGRGFRLGAASNHLIIETENGPKQIVATANFDDAGSQPVHAEILGPLLTRLEVQPDDSVELVRATHESLAFITFDVFTEAVYFKVGSIGATAEVVFSNSTGVPPDDFVFQELTLPASVFPANTEVRVNFNTGVSFQIGAQINPRLVSQNPFSILYNAAGVRFWTAIDTRATRKEDLLSHPLGLDRILMANNSTTLFDNAGNIVLRGAQL